MASDMIERAAKAVYPIPNVGMSDARAIASAALLAALDPEDETLVVATARGLLPVLCPGYENCPGDVFDPAMDVFTYQRTLCLTAARAALSALRAKAQGEQS